jgi:hypothetical protein
MYFAPSLFPAGGPFLPSLSVNLYFAPSPGPREHFPGGLGLGGPHWHPQLPPPLPASRLCIPMSPRPLPLPEVVAKKAFQHVLGGLPGKLEGLSGNASRTRWRRSTTRAAALAKLARETKLRQRGVRFWGASAAGRCGLNRKEINMYGACCASSGVSRPSRSRRANRIAAGFIGAAAQWMRYQACCEQRSGWVQHRAASKATCYLTVVRTVCTVRTSRRLMARA